MKMLAFAVACVGLGIALASCNAVSDDCSAYRTCREDAGAAGRDDGASAAEGGQAGDGGARADTRGEGGQAGSAEAGAGGENASPCDTSLSPRDEACLISDDFAVFVAPSGRDDNSGRKRTPLATLTRAIEVAGGEKLVLVCSGSYDEHVVVGAGARVFGGFDCADFRAGGAAPRFAPSDRGPALSIDAIEDDVTIEGIDFEVGDAEAAGETAIAAIVNASRHVTLRSVSLRAGGGQAGVNGKLSPFTFPDPAGFKGNAESPATMGGAEKICTCPQGATTTGGVGGTPSSSGQNGAKGLPSLDAGAGGDPAAGDCGSGSSGKKGADASARAPAAGAETIGTLSGSEWIPSSGSDGVAGPPGQGGGGGASLNNKGHGGGGGCGGCGGSGGGAGKGGGGSIALLAIGSGITLEASSLVTADAGKGGNGAVGQAGQATAGGGGAPIDTQNSCSGGSGGAGGAGGTGGGGAGGISVGIVWKGSTEPLVSADTTIELGKPGAKGSGGTPGRNDGIDGLAQERLRVE